MNDANGEESYGNMDGKYEHFATMNNVVVDKVKNIIEEESADGMEWLSVKYKVHWENHS